MISTHPIVIVVMLCFIWSGFGQTSILPEASRDFILNGTQTTVGTCGSESFINSNTTATYTNGRFTGDNDITWTYTESRNENGDANNSGIDGKAIMLRNALDNSAIISSSIPGGIGDFSVKLYKGFTSAGKRQVELFINGISQGTSTPFNDYDEHIFKVSEINRPGDITIELRNVTNNQIILDDIEWTCYTGDPSPELQLIDDTSINQNCGFFADFGSLELNNYADTTFYIRNIGSADLNINSIDITNNYTVVSPIIPFTLTSGNSQPIIIRFTPTTSGIHIGALRIHNNDLDEGTCIVNLIGQSYTPGPNIIVRGVLGNNSPTIANLSTSSSPLNNTYFAQQTINDTQQTKNFRIGNEGGTAPLTVSNMILSGDSDDFYITSNFTNPFPADNSQDFTITFRPTTQSGLRKATVTITNSDMDNNPFTFIVEGVANCPSVNGRIFPESGPAGTVVTIVSSGNDLTGATAILNEEVLLLISNNADELVVQLPNNITSGGTLSVQLTNGCVFSHVFTLIDKIISGCEANTRALVSNLFISEVTDSPTGSLTYVELYNATGSVVDFATTNYKLRLYNNGNTTSPKELLLNTGSVANNSTFVISIGVTGAQCSLTGGNGSLSQAELDLPGASINFYKNVSGFNNPNLGHDYFGLYSASNILIDAWGLFGDQTWATGLNLGLRGARFERVTSANIPNPTYSNADWIITDWYDDDCRDVDYSTIGNYDFSLGVPPIITVQPVNPSFSCSSTTSISVEAIEGFDDPTDTQDLAYQWFFNEPNTSAWIEIQPTDVNYTGQQKATLHILDTSSLNQYQYYCQVKEDTDSCYKASQAVRLQLVQETIWNGTSWTNSTPPDSYTMAIIRGNYTTGRHGSFSACGLIVDQTFVLTISDNTYVEIENNIKNAGEIYIDPKGSLVQVNNIGTITLTHPNAKNTLIKNTHALQNWYDYTYWSSPLENAQIENTLSSSKANRRFVFRADLFEDLLIEIDNTGTFIPGQDDIDDNGNDWENQKTGTMTPGSGYAAAHNDVDFTANQSYPYSFEGTLTSGGAFNNGAINMDIYVDQVVPYNNWNFIGNPYPSAISAQEFFNHTSSYLEGVIYFWSHNTNLDSNIPGNENLNFSQQDYAMFNHLGGIGTSTGPSQIPNGYIASGQGFFVIAKKSFGTIPGFYNHSVFNNAMRVTNNNDQFFRTSTNENKIWINLTSDNGVFSQILTGYRDGATNGFDGMHLDALRNLSTNASAILYSIIPDSNQKFAIQTKDPSSLNLNEVISIGYYTSINVPTLYTLSIEQFKGGFFKDNDVLVKDNLLQSVHNLSHSDYNFTSKTGEFNNRFELVFKNSISPIDEEEISPSHVSIIELQNGDITCIVPNTHKIKSVEIIDLLGRSLYRLKGQNSTETYHLSNLSQATYIVKITLSSGKVISKKVVKQR